jgi:hypothetical protein
LADGQAVALFWPKSGLGGHCQIVLIYVHMRIYMRVYSYVNR